MSLSEAPSVKITYSTPQDISDEILGGVIQFCRDTGYKQNMIMITFYWSAFLLSAKKILDENGILNDTFNCYTSSLGKVFPKVLENTEVRKNINNMLERYWNQLTTDIDILQQEEEIIKIAHKLNYGQNESAGQLKKDPLKIYSQYAFNIGDSIYRILHDIDDGICIQYKYVLNEICAIRGQSQQKPVKKELTKTASVNIPQATNQTNSQLLSMAWYKFLIYFGLIAGAVINFIYSLNYISGGIYFVETNGEVSAEQVYAYYGMGLQVVDVFYGVFLIAFAILAFIVRHKLANYKSDSLKFIKIFYSLSAGMPILYAILVAVITRQPLSAQTVISAIVGVVFLLFNIKYFKKRVHLFVNKTVSAQPPVQVKQKQKPVQKNSEIIVKSKSTTSTKQTCVFCWKCGTKLHEDSVFCHKCGIKTVPNGFKEEKGI